jgi:hypothetical protein
MLVPPIDEASVAGVGSTPLDGVVRGGIAGVGSLVPDGAASVATFVSPARDTAIRRRPKGDVDREDAVRTFRSLTTPFRLSADSSVVNSFGPIFSMSSKPCGG